jgi:hypothetical protein
MMCLILNDEHQDKTIHDPNEDKHHNHRKISQTRIKKISIMKFQIGNLTWKKSKSILMGTIAGIKSKGDAPIIWSI